VKRTTIIFGVLVACATLASAEIFDDKASSPGPYNTGALAEATGGPDDFGYIWADNAEPACAGLYNFVDITATGTAAGLSGADDDYAGPFPIGFSFDFYGTAQTEFYVGTNGTVYFQDAYLGLSNSCPLPATQGYTPQTFLALYHDDLVVQGNGDIYYQTFAPCPVGSGAQCTIIQFFNVRPYDGVDGDNMNFEVVLYADGSAVMLYDQPSGSDPGQNNGGSATVGIQGIDTSPPVWGIDYSCNAPSLSSGLAVAFAHPNAATAGVPDVCGQPATPTPAGPQPIPATSNTGIIVLVVLLVVTAFALIGRRAG